MQKTITHTANSDKSNLSPHIINQIENIWKETEFKPNESNQSTVVEETYTELPIANETTQPKKQENEAPATQPATQDDLQDKQQNEQATEAKGWIYKVLPSFNPYNWISSKNTANAEQPKIIIEEDNANPENSATINEAGNPGNKEDPFSTLDQLTPDDSEFKDATSTDSSLTGDDSNLLDN